MHNYAHSVSTEHILELEESTIRSWIPFMFIFVCWRVTPSANSYVIYDRRTSFTAFNDDSIIRRPHTQASRFIQLLTILFLFFFCALLSSPSHQRVGELNWNILNYNYYLFRCFLFVLQQSSGLHSRNVTRAHHDSATGEKYFLRCLANDKRIMRADCVTSEQSWSCAW